MYIYESNNSLMHYGVLGMRWGVRRYEDENGRLTAAGRKRYGVGDPRKLGQDESSGRRSARKTSSKSSRSSVNNTGSNSRSSDSSENSKLKTAAKVATVVGGAALMAGGVYMLTKTSKGRRLLLNGKNFVNVNLLKKPMNVDAQVKPNSSVMDDLLKPASKSKTTAVPEVRVDPKTGWRLCSDDMANMSISEHATKVNPNYSLADRRSYMNCGNCTFAMEMRMRGFDVKASGLSTGQMPSHIGQFFKGLSDDSFHAMDSEVSRLARPDMLELANDKALRVEYGTRVESTLRNSIAKAFPDDSARGALTFPHINGAHYIYWAKEGGHVKFFDAQNPSVDLKADLFGLYDYKPNKDLLQAIRLDNLEINHDQMRNIVQNSDEVFRNSDFNILVNKGENFVSRHPDAIEIDEMNDEYRLMEKADDYLLKLAEFKIEHEDFVKLQRKLGM